MPETRLALTAMDADDDGGSNWDSLEYLNAETGLGIATMMSGSLRDRFQVVVDV